MILILDTWQICSALKLRFALFLQCVCVSVCGPVCVHSACNIMCHLLYPLSRSNLHSSDTALLIISLTPRSQPECGWLNHPPTHTHLHTHRHAHTLCQLFSRQRSGHFTPLSTTGWWNKNVRLDGGRCVFVCASRRLLSVWSCSESWRLLALTGIRPATVMAHHSACTS